MNENYLPLAYLNAWEYCPRRFYLEYQLGEMEDNEHIIMGRYLHRNIDLIGIIQEEDTTIYRHQWVWSDRLMVNGIIDAVEEKDNQLIPLEYKKGRMGRHLNDHFQLCAAAICLEERLGKTIPFGEIFYHASRRRQKVDFTPQLRQLTEQNIKMAQLAVNQPMPLPIDNIKKCKDCSLKGICLPEEVTYLKTLI
ncbi:CRISPR-associated protein Cas4 [Aphanothece hegewaldii CCALA 016]|uniref:CRISPR-associated exonuclease Cas4 n=1 Tax=Aphanothece hegewaldii CCALA 016 TaxID=2107694 RepID=A0A2T1LYD7_9CHRO|nr:CRISPR-associated protein Cas4 [Aphanothece hegewaldii]PSF37396.1 CRISPR-associated protein Cas4 [Aphanothece hegewaldii CCALA 016]